VSSAHSLNNVREGKYEPHPVPAGTLTAILSLD